MYMQPEKPFANRLRQTWRDPNPAPMLDPDMTASDVRTTASAAEQPLAANATGPPSTDGTPATILVPLTAEGAMIGTVLDHSADEWDRIGAAVGPMLAGHPLGTALTSVTALARALEEGEKDGA